VFAAGGTLHVGRAIPRAWFDACINGEVDHVGAQGVHTTFGTVSVAYSAADAARLCATVRLKFHPAGRPRRVLVRFRHPRHLRILAARVNGKPHRAFAPETGDVDITGFDGTVKVEARYG